MQIHRRYLGSIATVAAVGCRSGTGAAPELKLLGGAGWEVDGDRGVRAMAESSASNLGREGPEAWLRHLHDHPECFMASDGEAKFASYRAMSGTSREELRLGGSFTGLGVKTGEGWKLRNAHGSSETSP